MAITTTIISREMLLSSPSYIIIEYQFAGVGAGSSSADVLALELPGPPTGVHRTGTPVDALTGESYAIRPINVTVASASTDLDLAFIDMDSTSAIGTIAQKLTLEGANLVKSWGEGVDFGTTILMNRDDSAVNYIYLALINNDGANATGTVNLTLTYLCVQDRIY